MSRSRIIGLGLGLALGLGLVAGALGTADARSRRLPAVELTVPDELAQPVTATGTLQTRRPKGTASGMALEGLTYAEAPDLVLHVGRDHTDLRLGVFGVAGVARIGSAEAYLEDGDYAAVSLSGGQLDAGDYVVWLKVPADAQGGWTVAVWDSQKSVIDLGVRYGQPADTAPVGERALSRYLPGFTDPPCEVPTAASAGAAHRLFTTLPRSFFVFPTQPISGVNAGRRPPDAGEPLLIEDIMVGTATVLTSDGVCFTAEDQELTTSDPAAIKLPPLRAVRSVAGKRSTDPWLEEDFLAFAAPPAVASYRAKKQAARRCYDKEGGADAGDRAASKCRLAALWAERDALEKKALAGLPARRTAWRGEFEARLKQLGLVVDK